jgi:uncharacterized coiled-coil protein SlyX
MTTGLLTQPRVRKGVYIAGTEVTKLKARCEELELTISSQQKLIEILKSLPGRSLQEVELIHEKATRKLQSRVQAKRGVELKECSTREPIDNGGVFGSDNPDSSQLENKITGANGETRP